MDIARFTKPVDVRVSAFTFGCAKPQKLARLREIAKFIPAKSSESKNRKILYSQIIVTIRQRGLRHFVLRRGCGPREYRTIIPGCHRNRLGDSTAWPVVWARELCPRSIEASICLLDCRLAKIGDPGRRQSSAAPTSEALVRRKGDFSSVGTLGECRHSKQQRSGSTTRTNSKGDRRTPSMTIKVRTAHLAPSWKSFSSLEGTRWI